VAGDVGSDVQTGLTESEARARRERFGANEVHVVRRSVGARVLAAVRDPLILVLLGAAALTIVTHDFADAVIILVVIVFNTAVGLFQELRAEQAISALNAVATPRSRIRRAGRQLEVAVGDIVPDDVVLLGEGDIVPADAVVHEAAGLMLDESTVTGESVPVMRDRPGDLLSSGTTVVRGRAVVIVSATGADSALGRIAAALSGAVRPTPLQRRLADLGRILASVVIGLSLVVLAVGLLRGEPVERMLIVAISLAVAAVPESLPAVVTLSLALGARRMSRREAIVRNLPAVETLGSVTILATDKTGTLTEGRMAVAEIWTPEGISATDLLLPAVLCNDAALVGAGPDEAARTGLGDPLEVALLESAAAHRISVAMVKESHPRESELPFDSARKRMTTVHRAADGFIVCCKGALDSMERDQVLGATEPALVADATIQAEQFAADGYRVLAVATGYRDQNVGTERDLALLGLVAFADPARQSAAATIAACRRAGITPLLITGDHPATARSIAIDVGVLDSTADLDAVVVGADIEHGLVDDLTAPRVLARTTPEQKLAVIEAWQESGAVVAMTGDGVNDAPALRRADIGVSMGRRATEVARQASDVVLADDELKSLVAAVEEGRRVYANVRRFLLYALTGGTAEILVMLGGPVLGLSVPLLASQILWINLLTHGLTGVAIGAEPASRDAMTRPPRSPAESILGRGLWWQVLVLGAFVAAVSLLVAGTAHHAGRPWQTMLFVTLTSLQLSVALATRAEPWSLANPFLLLMIAVSVLLIVAGIYLAPLRDLLGTLPLTTAELAVALAVGVFACPVASIIVRIGSLASRADSSDTPTSERRV
jgi:P-type Ca2+ transporter type 2C